MVALDVLLSVLRWIWEHGRVVFLALSGVLAVLWGRGCVTSNALSLELEACKNKPPVTIQAASAATATAKTITRVQIVYKDKDIPCPDVAVETEGETSAGAGTTLTAQEGLKMGPSAKYGVFSVSAGAGFYKGGVYPVLGGGVWAGPVGLEVQTLWPMAWDESQATRRPVATLGLTYRP